MAHVKRYLTGGAAVGAVLALLLHGSVLAMSSGWLMPFAGPGALTSLAGLLAQVLVGASAGALAGGVLALVGASRGRAWMLLAAVAGALLTLVPHLPYLLGDAGVPGPLQWMLAQAMQGMFVAGCMAAAAVGLYWHVTRGASAQASVTAGPVTAGPDQGVSQEATRP